MDAFTSNTPWFHIFPTAVGDFEVLAEVQIAGSTLRLNELAVAPARPSIEKPGYRTLRGVMEQIYGAALAQGFEQVEFSGKRITGAGAKTGRVANVRRRIV